MNQNKIINQSYFILALISTSFVLSKIIINTLYLIVGDSFIYYVFPTLLLIGMTSPLVYRFYQQAMSYKITPIIKKILFIYITVTTLLSFLIICDFVEVHWLTDTPIYIIVLSLSLLVFYIIKIPTFNIYKGFNLMFILFSIFLLVYFAFKIKLLYYPFLHHDMPKFHFNINALLLSVLLYFESFSIFTLPKIYEVPISKKTYYKYLFIILLFIIARSIIHLNEFRGVLKIIVYPFFESHNMIYFGQYIGHINFPVLFYYVISGFCKIAINIKLLQRLYTNPKLPYLFIFVCSLILIYLLSHNHLVANFTIGFIIISLLCDITLLILKLRSVLYGHKTTTKSLSKL